MRILIVLSMLLPTWLLAQSGETLKAMTFNIRFNNPGDGDNAWPRRVDMVERLLRYHSPDILGVQEALQDQMDDLSKMLPGHQSEGIARTEGGEYSAIFYRQHRLNRLDGSTFYLSTTPDTLSVGWDAALPRIVTWAKFQDRYSGHSFLCFNTHFDHVGEQARQQSAALILRAIDSLNPDNLPVMLLGDFNATPESVPIQSLLAGGMKDSRQASLEPAHGPDATWTGWTIAGEPGRRIDFVFVRGPLAVYRHATLAESFSGRFPSDHLPVIAEIALYPPAGTPGLHSHNDYAQQHPLMEALAQGATSIEADVWFIDGALRVCHDRPLVPLQTPTLEELYLLPLARWIEAHGGQVYPATGDTLQLMIDIKGDAAATYEALKVACEPYRWLPLRILLSGNRPVKEVLATPSTFLLLDGRTDELGNADLKPLIPMVSMPYREMMNWKGKGSPSEAERDALHSLLEKVHAQGATFRFWGVPAQPAVWEWLLSMGVDWLNVDDLAAGRELILSR